MKKATFLIILFCILALGILYYGQVKAPPRDLFNVENNNSILLTVLMARNDFDNANLVLANSVTTQKEKTLSSPFAEIVHHGINGEYTIHGQAYYVNFVHRLWRYGKGLMPDGITENDLYAGIPDETSELKIDTAYPPIYAKCAVFRKTEFKQCNVVFKHKDFMSILNLDISKTIENQAITDLINPVLSKIVDRIAKYENSAP